MIGFRDKKIQNSNKNFINLKLLYTSKQRTKQYVLVHGSWTIFYDWFNNVYLILCYLLRVNRK